MSETLLAQFRACKITHPQEAASNLDAIAAQLATSEDLRTTLGSLDIWTDLRKLWRDLVRIQLTFWDSDDDENDDDHLALMPVCAALARFTRNLVAGDPSNQQKAFENEPNIRRLLHYYTSWTAVQDKNAVLVARILTQTLSNMVTGNEIIMAKLWDIYMNLPEDQVILIRLLASTDHRTLAVALIFMRNCMQGSRTRAKLFTRTQIGARIWVSLLDNMVTLYDAAENSDGAKAFDVAYEIFRAIMEDGLVPDLYIKLSIQDEIITPHQTTLLKLVDSYLQSTSAEPEKKAKKARVKLRPMLAGCFFSLSSYAQHSIRRALGNNSPFLNGSSLPSLAQSSTEQQSLSELDVMLPKVCEALVLVTQCIITLALAEGSDGSPGSSPESEKDPKTYFNDSRSDNRGLVESLIELLRQLDLFLPRINFGRTVVSGSSASPSPSQHPASPENIGFPYLKRDLVRLLGILCHDNKAVQDRIRVCGGIEVVLNLCVIDERNPYLREHAIFALRNLLRGNAENQAVVEEIKPMGTWDVNSV